MSTEENFKFCSNCEKNIPANKWILHENFCIQHVKKCQICGEIINKEEEDEHILDYHSKRKCEICHEEFQGEAYFTHKQTCLSKLKCRFCHKEFAPNAFAEHEKNCDLNLFNCVFCFTDHPLKDKQDHQYFCGAKTDKCTKCDKYVRLRDMDMHISIDCHPEEIPISQKVDLNSIQIRSRKASGKTNTGVIASLSQMGILHKGDSKSKVKVKPNTNNSITENTPNSNNNNNNSNKNSSLATNSTVQANNLINKIKTNQSITKHENINETAFNLKTNNLKAHNLNSFNPANPKNNSIPIKIERKDLTPLKQNSNLHVNKPTSAKGKTSENKNSTLYNNIDINSSYNNKNHNESHNKLKEIENNLANLNNLGKNYQNINSQINKLSNGNVNKENKRNPTQADNKHSKHETLNPNKPTGDKEKTAGSGLNINYGVFEENKFEKPKFNVFYEKHESPYNSNLNDDDYVNINKDAKDKCLSANRYENINVIPNESGPNSNNKVRINENRNQIGYQSNKNNPIDKENKNRTTEPLKSNKAPGTSARQSSAIGNRDKKTVTKENTANPPINAHSNVNNTQSKVTPNKSTNEARMVKNLPYTKHFDINSSNINANNSNKSKNPKPESNSAVNKASATSSIYNVNNIFSNDAADKNKSSKNTQNDLIKLDQYIMNPNTNNNRNSDKNSQLNKIKKGNEEKINPVDNSKKTAYGTNKQKEEYKNKASSKNPNLVIKDGNIKASKKAQDINAKNVHFEDYNDDYLYDDGFNTQDYFKKVEPKSTFNEKQLEDDIINKVILESYKLN